MRFTLIVPTIVAALFTAAPSSLPATVSGTFSGTITSGIDLGIFAPAGTNLADQAISGSFSYNSLLLTTNDYPVGSPAGGASWFDPNAGSITQKVGNTSFVFQSTNYFNVFVGNPPSEPEDIFEIAANAYLPSAPTVGQSYVESYDLISFESYANFLSGIGPDQNPAITTGQITGEDEFYVHTWNSATSSYNVMQDLIYFNVTTLDGVTVGPLSSAPEVGPGSLMLVAATGVVAFAAVSKAKAEPVTSLYQRLGGLAAIRAVVDDLFSRIIADERVNGWFAHAASNPASAAAYRAALTNFLCQGTGGPCKYAGPDIATVHRGRGITDAAFDAVMEDLVATLNKLNVPDREKSDVLAILKPMKTAIVQTKMESRE